MGAYKITRFGQTEIWKADKNGFFVCENKPGVFLDDNQIKQYSRFATNVTFILERTNK